jgi:hypothetical protein
MSKLIYRNKETEATIDDNDEITITKINEVVCENTITLTIAEAINIANAVKKHITDRIDSSLI